MQRQRPHLPGLPIEFFGKVCVVCVRAIGDTPRRYGGLDEVILKGPRVKGAYAVIAGAQMHVYPIVADVSRNPREHPRRAGGKPRQVR